MRRHATAATVVSTVMLLAGGPLLAGCGGDATADPPAPASTSTSPTTKPSVSVPSMPAKAKRHGSEGAEAFVRHYVRAINFATFHGSTSELRKLGADSCRSCTNVVNRIEDIHRHGGYVRGGRWQLKFIESSVLDGPNRLFVDARIHFSPQTIHMKAGGPGKHYPGGDQIFNFWLTFKHGWQITRSTTAS